MPTKPPPANVARLHPPRRASVDAEGRPVVRVGFLPLADCAPLVIASLLGFDRRHGLHFELSRETSWAGIRDKLCGGTLDLAQALYGLVYGVELGIGANPTPMAVLMTLNRNGQGISLSRRTADEGATDLDSLATLIRRRQRRYTFGHTFPTGTHALWLNYWLAAGGIDPTVDLNTIVVPPAAMVDGVKSGLMDGFSVGEPWNQRGIREGLTVHAAASQDIWPDHPEKVLAATAAFADAQPDLAFRATCAVLEACRWLDAGTACRREAARWLSGAGRIDTVAADLEGRLTGWYEDGHGRHWHDPCHVRFFDDGAVTNPWLSDAMWFMTQFRRWGLIDHHPDYVRVARRVNRLALYRAAAAEVGAPVAAGDCRASRLFDGTVWDGSDPSGYADGFAIGAIGATAATRSNGAAAAADRHKPAA